MASGTFRKRSKLAHLTHSSKFKKTLLTSFKSMASVRIASITSRIKGHHVFKHKYKVGEEFSCFLEPGNPHSPSDNAIMVKTRVEGTDKKEAVVGHILEPLAQILGPMLKDETVHSIVAKITAEKRGAPEGVWVQAGGIELP